MRRTLSLVAVLALVLVGTVPAAASGGATFLDGPNPAIWLSDPEGVDGVSGIEQGDSVAGASGWARVHNDRAMIRVRATGLEPGHAYTMWVAYFNDQNACDGPCNLPDLAIAGAGVIWGDGDVARANGVATFVAKLRSGAGAEYIGNTPPPPFAFAPLEVGVDNEFHVIIRSHGPVIAGELVEQLTTFGGGCDVNVGPVPEQVGDFPVPLAPGECGDVQLYVFS